MLLHHYLEDTAQRRPDAVALTVGDHRFAFGQLDAHANAVAHGLIAAGVRRSDRVVIFLDNRVETVISIFGALKAGAAFMMVHPSTKEQKFDYLLATSEARAVVMPAARVPAMARSLESSPSLSAIVTTEAIEPAVQGKAQFDLPQFIDSGPTTSPDIQAIDLDLAALLFTSGSTGQPKGVMLTHLNLRTAVDAIRTYLRITDRDVLMNVLPLSFSYGLSQLFSAVSAGARFVLEKNVVFPHATVSKLATERVTGLAVVPTVAAVLLGLDLTQYDLSSLRYITNAGAALPSSHLTRLREALPSVDIVPMYGQTECMRISYLDPAEVGRRPDSVGRGMPNQELMLVDESGCEVGPGEVGELVVRGSHVMRGYWRQLEDTAAVLRPGPIPGERVLHTGDLFRQDDEGFYYFVARRDDVFKSRGEKVSPREVENALYKLPAVAEAAVVGVPDARFGQVVKAILVLRPGAQLSARDVQRHCAQHLEEFMVPAVVEFRDVLPQTESGKIHRKALA